MSGLVFESCRPDLPDPKGGDVLAVLLRPLPPVSEFRCGGSVVVEVDELRFDDDAACSWNDLGIGSRLKADSDFRLLIVCCC